MANVLNLQTPFAYYWHICLKFFTFCCSFNVEYKDIDLLALIDMTKHKKNQQIKATTTKIQAMPIVKQAKIKN